MMHYQKGKSRDQIFMVSLDQMVEPDSWARVVDLFVEAMPIEEFGFNNSHLNKEGNLPYHPADLFKLLLYGYRKGIRSANKLHEATRINVEVMWLLKGLRPSSRKICYFRSQNSQAIEKAHRYFVRLLKKWTLIQGNTLALDGTKIKAQNSLKKHFNQKKIDRHVEYIDRKMDSYLEQLSAIEKADESQPTKRKKTKGLKEKIDNLQERKVLYDQMQLKVDQSPDGQVCLTDPEAKMVIKHRNITEVGYNIQCTADAKHNLIVDVYAGGVNDLYEFGRAAKRAQQILDTRFIDMLADKGYHNGVEIAYAERRGVRPFISVKQNAHQKKVGYRKMDFTYDKDKKGYICPAGHTLNYELSYWKTKAKKPYLVDRYGTPKCEGCQHRIHCTTAAAGRKIERPIHQAYIDRNNNRVKRYPQFYRLRQQIIEHVFGTLKRHWGMTYTLLKGKHNVETEYRIGAICYNLKRSLSILGWKGLRAKLKKLVSFFMSLLSLILSRFKESYSEGEHSKALRVIAP